MTLGRRTLVTVALVLVVAVTGAYGWNWFSSHRNRIAASVAGQRISPTDLGAVDRAPGILLNEVLFQPAPNQSAFVEIENAATTTTTLDGLVLTNKDQQQWTFPAGVRLNAAEIAIVVFDGRSGVDGGQIHASPANFLDPQLGSVTISDRGGTLDTVVWNQNGGHSFWLGRGGHVSKVANGSTLGRLPHVTARGPIAWILYSPDESSPAKPNPYPGVTTMLPMSGAILKGLSTRLAWYT